MDELTYEMIMALNAADIGSPICEQVAAICAEIAEQHCSRLHVSHQVAPILLAPEPAIYPAAVGSARQSTGLA
jgi:hypothetical protein